MILLLFAIFFALLFFRWCWISLQEGYKNLGSLEIDEGWSFLRATENVHKMFRRELGSQRKYIFSFFFSECGWTSFFFLPVIKGHLTYILLINDIFANSKKVFSQFTGKSLHIMFTSPFNLLYMLWIFSIFF